jgi:hypothetical protein
MGRIPHVRSRLSDPLYGLRRRIERVDDRLDLLGVPARRVRALRSAGQGGDVGDAGNAGQDGEAIGEACVRFDHLENCCFDRRDLPINLFLDKGAYYNMLYLLLSPGQALRGPKAPGARSAKKVTGFGA